ncbi:phospholipid scramblase 1 [Tulasnella sp. 425]|nr:phospholipid scramblase 1 [Tulasnella sp. 425]
MPSKSLKSVWAFLNVALLASGAVLIAFSVIWRTPDVVRNFLISNLDLTAGLVLGIMFLVTWLISIAGILQQNHVTVGLVATNWALIMDAIGVMIIGTMVWVYTLQPTKNFLGEWEATSSVTRQSIQDTLKCCGYRNSTEFGIIGGFCSDDDFAASQVGCSTIILPKADYTLNNVFSVIYGFMAVIICFFLATVSLVYQRKEEERFRKIDEKRGGRGFV